MLSPAMLETSLFGRSPDHRGKVRDTYDLGDRRLLVVATDRISALDIVFANGIPGKGKVLTQLSAWWFGHIDKWRIPHHFLDLVTAKNEDDLLGQSIPPEYHGRSMVVRKAEPLKCEAIVRGYITGSGWKDYQATGDVCGITLPHGLLESQRLPEPLFTPSTKADLGEHDENISYQKLIEIIGPAFAEYVQMRSLIAYEGALQVALERGVIIADTKFEFGWDDGRILLIDEVLTPDSSRFWPADGYKPGQGQPSFDKQPVRDWLGNEIRNGRWKEGDSPPTLASQQVKLTTRRYLEIYSLLTGKELTA